MTFKILITAAGYAIGAGTLVLIWLDRRARQLEDVRRRLEAKLAYELEDIVA